ncbi:MAG: PSD1 and planctomycete cytochrome C domain-containing protein [Acidobacteria bacterium]|nr:PSD1 and planctomycete cytochrome C domain-containing protein [Acidobacteriota bacterium]
MIGSNYLSKSFDSFVFRSVAGQRALAIIRSLLVALFIPVTSSLPVSAAEGPKPDPSAIEFFEKQVRPLLVKQCISCHGEAQQFSSLRVDSRETLLKGGNRGPAIIPGDATLSLLAKAVRHEGLKMPMGSKLTPEEIAAIEKWINLGAPWPSASAVYSAAPPGFYEKIRKEHWAFQPLNRPPLDKGGLAGGGTRPCCDLPLTAPLEKEGGPANAIHPVDHFIRTALSIAALKPAEPADRQTLVRRLSLVLTGLPPTPLEVDLFVLDASPEAYARLVDRLLASPHFGERWARHWMDVMRFAETFGNDWNYEIKGAWLYRDYLIRAFNQDVPYDQLIREHLAGDLLQKPRINAKEGINESVIGTSFLRLGELGHDDCIRFRQIRTDVVDNQIDTLGKAFQGLTVACARCHDHKLDPIPTSDYYALYGALTSSRMVMRNADTPDVNAAAKQRLRELKPLLRSELAKQWIQETSLMPRYLMAAHRAWKGLPPKQQDLIELSLDRIQAWLALLEKQKPGMEEPLYPWIQSAGSEPAQEWRKLQSSYAEETRSRVDFNRENFLPFGDLARDGFGGWYADGNASLDGPSPSGEFAVANSGPAAVTGVFPAGIYTHALSERLDAALRSPLVPKDKKFLTLQVVGGRMGAWRPILDNCMLSEGYQLLDSDSPRWLKIPNRDDQPTLPFYVELVTKGSNPRIPDRPERLKRDQVTQAQLDSPYSYFGIARAFLHDVDESPREELSHLAPLFAGASPASREALAERYAAIIRRSLDRWAAGKSTDDDARWIGWLLENRLVTNASSQTPRLHRLVEDYRLAESRIAAPKTFNGMADLEAGYDFPVLPAGDAEHPGKIVPRGFLQLITGTPKGVKAFGSGRLEIANLIASPANPLTARVMANRIWLHVFGRGIVPTADNFGVYGERPSHPELLDALAAQFIREGWSIKKHIRFLLMSQTFQQSSQASPEALVSDPQNRLLSHYLVRRLEGESVRDAILAASGRLDRTMYGPSIQPYREEPKDYRKLHQGPLDGNGRRSIYIKVTRHEGSRFLDTFDFPNPTVARGNRDTTNVPAQALALLNDPFVLDQAGVWADKLIKAQAPTVESRLDSMFRTALGRSPDDVERARFAGLAKELASLHKAAPGKILESREVWKDMAHAIFNLKEFTYLR